MSVTTAITSPAITSPTSPAITSPTSPAITSPTSPAITSPTSPAIASPTSSPVDGPGAPRVTLGRIAKAELFKFGSVRSNVVALLGSAGAAIGLGMLFSQLAESGDGPAANFTDGLGLSLAGFDLAMMIVAILGVATVAIEYQTGLIQGWFATAPDRLRVLWAKVGVYSSLAFAVTGVAALIAFVASQALLPETITAVSLGDDGVMQALAGTALYASVIAAIGVSLGFMLRSTAAGASVVMGLLLIAPIMIGLLPAWIADPVGMILPSNAASAITGLGGRGAELLSTTGGIVALGAWAFAAIGGAALALKTRDA